MKARLCFAFVCALASPHEEDDILLQLVRSKSTPWIINTDKTTNECPAVATRIVSEAECLQAITDLGFTQPAHGGFSVNQPWHHIGCVVLDNGQGFWNINPEGIPHNFGRVICKRKWSVSSQARINDCPEGTGRLYNESDCFQAISDLNFTRQEAGSVNQAWQPRGCVVSGDNEAFWNAHPVGAPRHKSRLICRTSGANCEDSPHDWHDNHGRGCAYYSVGDRCDTEDTALTEGNQLTENTSTHSAETTSTSTHSAAGAMRVSDACCACGGGAKTEESQGRDWSELYTTLVHELEGLDEEMETVKKLAEAAQSSADSAQASADSAQASADNAQASADNATDDAESAQSTADDGRNRAIRAKETADDGRNRAINAQSTADDGRKRAIQAQSTATDGRTRAIHAQNTANSAASTAADGRERAIQAQSTANSAQSTATDGRNRAITAQSTATAAQSTATDGRNRAIAAADAAYRAGCMICVTCGGSYPYQKGRFFFKQAFYGGGWSCDSSQRRVDGFEPRLCCTKSGH